MTSLELHEYLTPEQHQRWMKMVENDYDLAVEQVYRLTISGASIYQAIKLVDELHLATMNLDSVPF